jgi:WD40 repeat protein
VRRLHPHPFLLLALLATAAAAERQPLAKLPGPAGTAVAFTRDGKLILTAGGNEARVWDAKTFRPVTPPLLHAKGEKIVHASISPDSRFALTVAGGEGRLWDAATGRTVRAFRHEDGARVTYAAFSPDGSLLVTTGSDNAARLWDVRTGKEVHVLTHEAPVMFAAFDPAGSRVVTLSDSTIQTSPTTFEKRAESDDARVWDVRTGKKLGSRDADVGPGPGLNGRTTRRPVVFTADGERVVTIGTWIAFVWVATTGGYVSEVDGRAEYLGWELGGASVFALSADGTRLAIAGQNSAGVWDVRNGLDARHPLAVLRVQGIDDIQFSPDGCQVLIATDTDDSGVWDVASVHHGLSLRPVSRERQPEVLRSPMPSPNDWRSWLMLPKPITGTPAIAFCPDGRRVAAGFASDGFTGVWEVPQSKEP